MSITDSINCSCSDTTGNRTLAELRYQMMVRMGWAATANNPAPGVAEMLNSFLQGAQRAAIARPGVAMRTERFFSWPLTANVALYDFPDNSERRQIPAPTTDTPTTATTGGAFTSGTKYARISAINANGETLASTEVSMVVPAGTSTNTVTWKWITPTVPSGASPITGYKIYRSATTGAELYIATTGLVNQYVDTGTITPAGALPTQNTTAICRKQLDPYKVTEVGIQIDTTWTPLRQGIPADRLFRTITGRPERYEFRQCIQLWPPPASTEGNLIIKGDFGLEPFEDDDDPTTINDDLVFLLALANAKAHYKHPDANHYVSQFEVLLASIVAGSHGTARYVPGRREEPQYVEPKPTVPFP